MKTCNVCNGKGLWELKHDAGYTFATSCGICNGKGYVQDKQSTSSHNKSRNDEQLKWGR